MKELNIEEKAKRYDEAIEITRAINSGEGVPGKRGDTVCECIFPEIKEKGYEEIKKQLIEFLDIFSKCGLNGNYSKWDTSDCANWLIWVKKQKEQHCPKENKENEETNTPTEYGKYVDECLNEAAKHFFSEGEDKYSVADLFYAGIKCKEDWLKKQGEYKPNPYSGVSFEYNGHTWGMCARDGGVDIGYDKQLIANINPIREKDEFDNLNKAIDNKDISCNTVDFIKLTPPNHGV